MPSDEGFDESTHDLAVDNTRNPSVLRVKLKVSKTDSFRKGVFLFIGKNDSE